MKKADFRRNAPYVIASGACTAWQSINTQKADSREAYFASAKFMDRHADKSARDDRKTPSLRDTASAVAWQSTIKPFRRDLGAVCLTAKRKQGTPLGASRCFFRKRFIPTPLPLTQKEKATAFSFCNQGESLALPLLALARRRDTTARLTPAIAHHEAGENRCELTLAI